VRGSKSDARLASCFPTAPSAHPAVLAFHLRDDLADDRRRRARRLKRCLRRRLLAVGGGARKQVLGVDEAAAGLAEALRRLLLAEAVHVHALLADAGGEPGEVAVGGHEAEAVEAAAVKEVHGVDHQGDVRGVLARGVGELLLGNDGVLRQDVGPGLRAGAGEVAVDAPHAGLADLGDFLEQPVGDLRRGIVGVDENGKAGRACRPLPMSRSMASRSAGLAGPGGMRGGGSAGGRC
jgi:hypothetical protein